MKPPLTIEESLAQQEEFDRKNLNKNLRGAFITEGMNIEDKVQPDGYRILDEREKTSEWVQGGIIWIHSCGGFSGPYKVHWMWNVDEKGCGIYTQPGHIYAVPV